MKKITSIINELSYSPDYIIKNLSIDHCLVQILYNENLVNLSFLSNFVLNPIIHLSKDKLLSMDQYIPIGECKIIIEDEIVYYLNMGYAIVLYEKIFAIPVMASLSRGVPTISSELSLTGPKDSLSELFTTNLALIRRRIKSEHLQCTEMVIGRYSKTKIGILAIDGIVKKDLVRHVQERLHQIDIDGVLDSSYLKSSLEKRIHLFPTIIMTERPDKCSMALLEGKVVILVDNSPYALILPGFFVDCFHTTDDYYQKSFHVSFIRIIRLFAFLIAIYTPALYLSVTTRNYDLVSFDLLLMLKAGRSNVPFPAYIEALFMIICFEILKESDLRMSTTSGSAISILGGLILGDAAVAAGIVSPIMIIIIAISSIAGLIFTSIELENTLRTYKILFLFLSSFFGILGVCYGTILLLYQLLSTEIFGYQYFTFTKEEMKDSILKIDSKIKKRSPRLSFNRIRGRIK